MSLTLDSTPHVDAGVAAVLAVWERSDVYPFGEVPGANGNEGREPDTYLRVSAERRYLAPSRMVGRAGRVSWRMSVRAVSLRADNARAALAAAAKALNETRLTVDGDISDPVQHETTTDLDYDDGHYVADLTYTYVC